MTPVFLRFRPPYGRMSLPALFDSPLAYAGLVVVIYAALRYQATLTWPEYRVLHGIKRRVAPLVDPIWGGAVADKGGRDDAEFVGTTAHTVRETFAYLNARGFDPHLINSLKRRPDAEYSAAHLVTIHPDGRQTEIYLFGGVYGTDVYAHVETAVTDPRGHLENTEQVDGDARDTLPPGLFEPES